MEIVDYSPPASPSLEHQQDSLRKGLGRAMQWASSGKLAEEPLLEACLHDLRFDRQVESYRASWLWKIITNANVVQLFRDPLLSALYRLQSEVDAGQLCELAYYYAQRGDDSFRKRLYEIVEQKPFADWRSLGEEQITALNGERGFLFAARIRGAQLDKRVWEWDDGQLVEEAIQQIGETQILNALRSSTDTEISRFRDTWFHQRNLPSVSPQPYKERMQRIGVDEIIQSAESLERRYGQFRGWGIHAQKEDLEAVFARLLEATDTSVLINYLAVFSKRELPRLDSRLWSLCEHPDEMVRRRAFTAIAQLQDPQIRQYAQSRLHHGSCDGLVVSLLEKNFQEGDEDWLFEWLRIPDDQNELHWLLSDIIDILEANPNANSSRLGLVAYALTPCANCRFRAARHLHRHHAAPLWLKDECLHDVDPETRKLHDAPEELS